MQNLNIPECSAGHARGTTSALSTAKLADGVNPFARVDCTQASTAAKDEVTAFLQGFATLTKIPAKPGSSTTGGAPKRSARSGAGMVWSSPVRMASAMRWRRRRRWRRRGRRGLTPATASGGRRRGRGVAGRRRGGARADADARDRRLGGGRPERGRLGEEAWRPGGAVGLVVQPGRAKGELVRRRDQREGGGDGPLGAAVAPPAGAARRRSRR